MALIEYKFLLSWKSEWRVVPLLGLFDGHTARVDSCAEHRPGRRSGIVPNRIEIECCENHSLRMNHCGPVWP